ncbi:MAG: hypothetical protein ACE5E9_03370 [Nitrospinaceae bacterium]
MKSNPILILFRMRWNTWRNLFIRPTRDKVIRWTLLGGMGALFVYGDYRFFLRIIKYLDGMPLQIGDELIGQLLNVIFLTLFVMVLFSSLIVTLSVFYLSKDLGLIHSLPVRESTVVFTRFIQTVIHSSWMVLLFSIPIFTAYGSYFGVPWEYYLYLALNIVPFMTMPCLLGSLLILALMRYFPTRKAHQVLSFLGLVFLAGLVAYLRFLSPEKFFGQEVSDDQIILFVESLKVPDYKFLPSSWMTLGLTGWVLGETSRAFDQSLYLYSTTIVLTAVLWRVSRRIYFEGWCRIQEVRSAPTDSNGSVKRKPTLIDKLPLPPAQRALLAKDIKIFTRDPEQWSQIFILIALVFVYIFNIMNLPLNNPVLKNVVSVLNIGLVGFVLSALISRFVFSATSVEGKRIWTIYTAPVDMEKFLWSKFWMFFPPLLFIAEFLVIVSNHLLQVDAYVMNVSIIGVFLITVALVGLGLGLGAMYPMFEHENISQIPAGTGGILFMTLSFSYVGLVMMLGGRPLYVHFNEKFLFKPMGGIDVPICYALILLLTLAATFLPLHRGIQTLKRMDI